MFAILAVFHLFQNILTSKHCNCNAVLFVLFQNIVCIKYVLMEIKMCCLPDDFMKIGITRACTY